MFLVDLYLICNSVLSGIYICASRSRDHQYFAHERLMCIRCQCDGIYWHMCKILCWDPCHEIFSNDVTICLEVTCFLGVWFVLEIFESLLFYHYCIGLEKWVNCVFLAVWIWRHISGVQIKSDLIAQTCSGDKVHLWCSFHFGHQSYFG